MAHTMQGLVQAVMDATVGQGLTIGETLEVLDAARRAVLGVVLRPAIEPEKDAVPGD